MKPFETLLSTWNAPLLKNEDLEVLFPGEDQRHSLIKRALAKKTLISIKRGIYVIGVPYQKFTPNPFTIACLNYGPSFISFETALSYYGWIPESSVSIACACSKRNKTYKTELGRFVYFRTPLTLFYLETKILEDFIIACPWRALADLCYVRKKDWQSAHELSEDLRIEFDVLDNVEISSLRLLSQHYPSRRVQKVLKKILESIHGYENHRPKA